MGLFSFLTQEIAIDLGTANTIIIHNDKIVVDEPSIVALDQINNKLIAIGEQARQMHGKTHENIKTVRPLRDGVIADFNAAEQMIRGMIKMINPKQKFFIDQTYYDIKFNLQIDDNIQFDTFDKQLTGYSIVVMHPGQ